MSDDWRGIRRDVQMIKKELKTLKRLLVADGELTPWARKALARARQQHPSTYVDIDDL